MIDRSIPIARFVQPERGKQIVHRDPFAPAILLVSFSRFFPFMKPSLSLLLFMNINHIFNKKRKQNDKILFELDFR